MIRALIQHIEDWRRERRIDRLRQQCEALCRTGQRREAAAAFAALTAECKARSRQQVARMERRIGMRPRTAIKRAVFAGYCHRMLPAGLVAIAFRALRLRGL